MAGQPHARSLPKVGSGLEQSLFTPRFGFSTQTCVGYTDTAHRHGVGSDPLPVNELQKGDPQRLTKFFQATAQAVFGEIGRAARTSKVNSPDRCARFSMSAVASREGWSRWQTDWTADRSIAWYSPAVGVHPKA